MDARRRQRSFSDVRARLRARAHRSPLFAGGGGGRWWRGRFSTGGRAVRGNRSDDTEGSTAARDIRRKRRPESRDPNSQRRKRASDLPRNRRDVRRLRSRVGLGSARGFRRAAFGNPSLEPTFEVTRFLPPHTVSRRYSSKRRNPSDSFDRSFSERLSRHVSRPNSPNDRRPLRVAGDRSG